MVLKFKGKFWYGEARQATNSFAAQNSSTANEISLWAAPQKVAIKRVTVIFDSTVTGAADDNFGVRVKNKGPAGAGTDVVCTKTFSSGVDATALDGADLGAISNNVLNAGDTISFEKFENGSGANMPAGTVVVEYVKY